VSTTSYNPDTMTVTVDDAGVQQALGDLAEKTPAVIKTAINKTARQMRSAEIREAKSRYALTPKGQEKLKNLKQTRKATNANLENIHRQNDMGRKLDMAYFQHRTSEVHTGWDAVMNSPRYYTVKVLKSEGFHNIVEGENKSKGFLAQFSNGHIGMVNRKLDHYTQNYRTKKGKRRWRATVDGKKKGVEALETTARPGASDMEAKVWRDIVREETEGNLQENVQKRIEQVVANAAKKR